MMKRLERAAVLIALMEELESQGSWCGETHIQKSTFFLQEIGRVPLQFNFIMYKHGPFSFDLRQELTRMRADRMITVKIRDYKYPGLQPTEQSLKLKDWHSHVLEKFQPQVKFIASIVGGRNVKDLEKLSAALFVKKQTGPEADADRMVSRLLQLKPHLSEMDVRNAFNQVDDILHEANESGLV